MSSIAVVLVVLVSAALVSAPAAMAVDGDPIATSVFKAKFSKAFTNQLKQNGVTMKPKKLSLDLRGTSDVVPTTGAADLRFKKIVFKKGKKRVIYDRLSAALPGKVKSPNEGSLFKLTKAKVARSGFGANLTGVKVKFLKSAAKKLNKRLGLNSLNKGNAGSLSLSYQPETVRVVSGTAQTTSVSGDDPEFTSSVGFKFLVGHCVNGTAQGILPLPPASKESLPTGQVRFTFPVVGGDISPTGTEGVTEQAGGLQIKKTGTSPPCMAHPHGELTQTQIQTNITARQISSVVNIIASPATEGTAAPGLRGRAVGQVTDPANVVVTADPANRTISVSGSVVRLAPLSASTLNQVFPNVSGDPANDFVGGDPFGSSALTVQVR